MARIGNEDLNGSQNWRGIFGSYDKIETTAVITKKRGGF